MSYIVDASVAIKWFVREVLHEKALALLHAHGGNLEAPDFVLTEISNVAWKKSRQGMLSDGQAKAILSECFECFATLHPTPGLSERALDLAMELGHPVYDCLYLACAEQSGRVLVTADLGICDAVKATKYAGFVLNIGEWTEPLSQLTISEAKIGEVIKAHEFCRNVLDHVENQLLGEQFPNGEFVIRNMADLRPYFDSPAYHRLLNLIEGLNELERTDLLALGWYGRGGEFQHATFEATLVRARTSVQRDFKDPNFTLYIAAQVQHVEDGLARLVSSQ